MSVRVASTDEVARPERRPTGRPAPAPMLLAVQRAAGNAAACRMVGAPRLTRSPAGAPAAPARAEGAGAAALRDAVLARKLKVADPKTKIKKKGGRNLDQTNAATIQVYLHQICPTGGVAVDAKSGRVTLSGGYCDRGGANQSPAEQSATPNGCGCLCDMIASAHSWTIEVDDKQWPHTKFNSHKKAGKPSGTGGTVTAPSPNGPKVWGAGTVGGAELDTDPWLVLAHELCGHAWLGDRGLHGPDDATKRGKGGHQETVKRENLIRQEQNIALRGGFKDPNCGESYWRSKDDATNKTNWSNFRDLCIAWRDEYNKQHHTNYTIDDKIP